MPFAICHLPFATCPPAIRPRPFTIVGGSCSLLLPLVVRGWCPQSQSMRTATPPSDLCGAAIHPFCGLRPTASQRHAQCRPDSVRSPTPNRGRLCANVHPPQLVIGPQLPLPGPFAMSQLLVAICPLMISPHPLSIFHYPPEEHGECAPVAHGEKSIGQSQLGNGMHPSLPFVYRSLPASQRLFLCHLRISHCSSVIFSHCPSTIASSRFAHPSLRSGHMLPALFPTSHSPIAICNLPAP